MAVYEMETLQLDTVLYAETIAQTLAIIHWKAKLDANDVEFVLGSTPAPKMPPTAAELVIWLLDFDQCQDFAEGEKGVEQLKRAFYFHDPYYHRPSSTQPNDKLLWNAIKESHLVTSAAFTTSDMPKRFVDAVEAEGEKGKYGGSMFR